MMTLRQAVAGIMMGVTLGVIAPALALDDPYGYQAVAARPVTMDAAIAEARERYRAAKGDQRIDAGIELLSLYERAGAWKPGLKVARKLRRVDPDHAELFKLHNRLLVRRIADVSVFGKLGAAKDMRDNCRRMAERDPESGEAVLCLIRFNSMARGFADSDSDRIPGFLDQLSKIDQASYHLAQAELTRERDAEGARTHYRQAFNAGHDIGVGIEAIRFFAGRQNYDEAVEIAETLKAKNAGDQAPVFLYQQGRLAAISGQNREEGISALLRFLSGPTYYKARDYRAGAHWRLGQLFEAEGNKELAEIAYRNALDIDDDFKPAERSLDNMGG